jgi:hypothetical protein
VKKLLLLPLLGIIGFSLNAWDWRDPAPVYSYDTYNYYNERPWLLPPSEYYWYHTEKMRSQEYILNLYLTEAAAPAVSQAPVYITPGSTQTPGSVFEGYGDPNEPSNYRFQDLDLSSGSPFMGYQNLPWGTTVTQFLSLYNDAWELTDGEDASLGVRRFEQQALNEGIRSRQFLFFNNRLYEVYVLYGYVDESIYTQMQGIFTNFYGTPATSQRQHRSENYVLSMGDFTYQSSDGVMQVVFTVSDVYDADRGNAMLGTLMTCLFSDLSVKNAVEGAYY